MRNVLGAESVQLDEVTFGHHPMLSSAPVGGIQLSYRLSLFFCSVME